MTNKGKITFGVILKYTLVQLPDIALFLFGLIILRKWVEISDFLFWSLFVVWVAEDILLFPFLWRSYASRKDSKGVTPMTDRLGVVRDHLASSGYIRVDGELWLAELEKGSPAVPPGGMVRVKEVRGLTLIVESVDKEK